LDYTSYYNANDLIEPQELEQMYNENQMCESKPQKKPAVECKKKQRVQNTNKLQLKNEDTAPRIQEFSHLLMSTSLTDPFDDIIVSNGLVFLPFYVF